GGPALFVSGYFSLAGGQPASYFARWRSGQWTAMPIGPTYPIGKLAVFDDGTGTKLYGVVPGGIGVFAGAGWTRIGGISSSTPYSPYIQDLRDVELPWGHRLVVGGLFSAIDGVPMVAAAQWDGASWTPLRPEPLSNQVSDRVVVSAVGSVNDGTGAQVL